MPAMWNFLSIGPWSSTFWKSMLNKIYAHLCFHRILIVKKKYNKIILPLHMSPLHPSAAASLPLQFAPPLAGLGLAQSRKRRWTHSAEHGDHGDHSVHPPEVAEEKTNFNTNSNFYELLLLVSIWRESTCIWFAGQITLSQVSTNMTTTINIHHV